MLSIKYFLINLISLTIYNYQPVITEWVEIPEFSDYAKVYQTPFIKYNDQKLFFQNQDRPSIHEYPNISVIVDGNRQTGNNYRPNIVKSSERISSITFRNNETSTTTVNHFGDVQSGVSIDSQIEPDLPDDDDDDAFVEEPDESTEEYQEFVTVPTIYVDNQVVVHNDQLYKPVIDLQNINETQKAKSKKSFLNFVPVELFKKVHGILMAQPATLRGKIAFLKDMKITILTEIEKRLVPALSSVRTKRESRDDSWDEHHDSVGFPSLEGALMAISFLTFAVYLVQLVMILFRNLGNNPTNTGTATLLFNRNKRSPTEFAAYTARILEYLEKFETNA